MADKITEINWEISTRMCASSTRKIVIPRLRINWLVNDRLNFKKEGIIGL